MLYYQKKIYEFNDFDYDDDYYYTTILYCRREERCGRYGYNQVNNLSKSNMRERAESSLFGVKLQMNGFQVQM